MGARMLQTHIAWLALSGSRPSTVRHRERILRQWEAWLDVPVPNATHHDVMAWLGRDLKPESRRTYLTALKGFYAWAVDEGICAEDPTVRVPSIHVRRGTPRPISSDDLRRALDAADYRMRAWLLLMALAGLRCMEVAALRPRDLMEAPAGWLLHLRETKGGRPATVPAHPDILDCLAALPVRDGAWWITTPLYVSQRTAQHLRSCRIDATAHQLRHTAATVWYEVSGHDLLVTARLLRHARVSSTEIYTRIDPTRPMEVAYAVTL